MTTTTNGTVRRNSIVKRVTLAAGLGLVVAVVWLIAVFFLAPAAIGRLVFLPADAFIRSLPIGAAGAMVGNGNQGSHHRFYGLVTIAIWWIPSTMVAWRLVNLRGKIPPD